MKTVFFFLLLSLAIHPWANSQTKFTQDQEAFYQKAMKQINPRYVKWIKTNAKEIGGKDISETEIKSLISQDKTFTNLQNGDIEALVFLVMMEASKNSQEELKEIMNNLKATNEKKNELREAKEKLDKNRNTVTRTQLDSLQLVMEKTKTATVKNNKQRNYITKINTAPVTKNEIESTIDKIQNELDSKSEMGEMESLRLQMMMDRRSKMMSTLSNVLKKISDTQDSIIQNLK